MLTHCNYSFTAAFSDEPQKKMETNLPPHAKSVAALPFAIFWPTVYRLSNIVHIKLTSLTAISCKPSSPTSSFSYDENTGSYKKQCFLGTCNISDALCIMETYCWLALPVAGCWVTAQWQDCVCRLGTVGSDPKMAWQHSFSDEMRVRGVLYMIRAIQIDVFIFFTLIILQ